MKIRNGSVRIIVDESANDDPTPIERKKTPLPRVRKGKISNADEDLDEDGIVDRDEDLFNDDDDVSTSTMHGSDYSLEEYIKEENKINAEKTNGHVMNGKLKTWKQFMSNIRDKGKGLSCKNADNVISEQSSPVHETSMDGKVNPKSCSLM